MYGVLPFGLNVAGPGLVAIGTRVQELAQWRAELGRDSARGEGWAPWALAFLDLAEAWLSLPNCPLRPEP